MPLNGGADVLRGLAGEEVVLSVATAPRLQSEQDKAFATMRNILSLQRFGAVAI